MRPSPEHGGHSVVVHRWLLKGSTHHGAAALPCACALTCVEIHGQAVCGSPASHDTANTVKWMNKSDTSLVTGGINALRMWQFDPPARKVCRDIFGKSPKKRSLRVF